MGRVARHAQLMAPVDETCACAGGRAHAGSDAHASRAQPPPAAGSAPADPALTRALVTPRIPPAKVYSCAEADRLTFPVYRSGYTFLVYARTGSCQRGSAWTRTRGTLAAHRSLHMAGFCCVCHVHGSLSAPDSLRRRCE